MQRSLCVAVAFSGLSALSFANAAQGGQGLNNKSAPQSPLGISSKSLQSINANQRATSETRNKLGTVDIKIKQLKYEINNKRVQEQITKNAISRKQEQRGQVMKNMEKEIQSRQDSQSATGNLFR